MPPVFGQPFLLLTALVVGIVFSTRAIVVAKNIGRGLQEEAIENVGSSDACSTTDH